MSQKPGNCREYKGLWICTEIYETDQASRIGGGILKRKTVRCLVVDPKTTQVLEVFEGLNQTARAERFANEHAQGKTGAVGRPPEHVWFGASGQPYTYQVFDLSVDIGSDQWGNYIYAKQTASGLWVPVYFGQGDLCVRCGEDHHKHDCVNGKGATHIHAHLNGGKNDEDVRCDEEADLLAAYPDAYAPSGCNERRGG